MSGTQTTAPGPRKIKLTEVATGKQLERWPVDARDLLKAQDADGKPMYTLNEGQPFTVTPSGSVAQQEPVRTKKPNAAPGSGKIRLKNTITKEEIERWPVDARDILKFEGWIIAQDEEAAPVTPEAPILNPDLVKPLEIKQGDTLPAEYAPGVGLNVAVQGGPKVGTSGPMQVSRSTGKAR